MRAATRGASLGLPGCGPGIVHSLQTTPRRMSPGAASTTLAAGLPSSRRYWRSASAPPLVGVPSVGIASTQTPYAHASRRAVWCTPTLGSAAIRNPYGHEPIRAPWDTPSIGFPPTRKPCRQRAAHVQSTEVQGLVSTAQDLAAGDAEAPLEKAEEEVSELARDLRRVASDARWLFFGPPY